MKNYELAEKDYMLGMKYKDIAAKYGVSIATVKSWKTRYKWSRISHTNQKRSMRSKKGMQGMQNIPAIVSDKNDGLTEKQRLFCLYYVKNFNATQAYLKAYGCSYDVANAEGYKLLVKPCVKAEVARLKEIKRQSIMLDPDDIVERYMRIAFADMTDVAEWGYELIPETDINGAYIIGKDGNIKFYKRNYLDFKNSDQVDGGLICEVSLGKSGMKVKLEDRQKALDWLSDYFNMNPMSKHKQQYDNAVLQLRERELNLKEF